ncbi:hypothetical protein VNO77_07985 [Canavalia gladiata]|uniref:Uncharacterized protein n=1 Tax=Canavalia gladiata TaxID=3824 RepID=A0AAN9M8W0_CANGL
MSARASGFIPFPGLNGESPCEEIKSTCSSGFTPSPSYKRPTRNHEDQRAFDTITCTHNHVGAPPGTQLCYHGNKDLNVIRSVFLACNQATERGSNNGLHEQQGSHLFLCVLAMDVAINNGFKLNHEGRSCLMYVGLP